MSESGSNEYGEAQEEFRSALSPGSEYCPENS